jgi:hypothetical protein
MNRRFVRWKQPRRHTPINSWMEIKSTRNPHRPNSELSKPEDTNLNACLVSFSSAKSIETMASQGCILSLHRQHPYTISGASNTLRKSLYTDLIKWPQASRAVRCCGRHISDCSCSNLPWVWVHAFQFNALQLMSGIFSSYLKLVLKMVNGLNRCILLLKNGRPTQSVVIGEVLKNDIRICVTHYRNLWYWKRKLVQLS